MKNSLTFIFIMGFILLFTALLTPPQYDFITGYVTNIDSRMYLLGFSELIIISSAIGLIRLNFKK